LRFGATGPCMPATEPPPRPRFRPRSNNRLRRESHPKDFELRLSREGDRAEAREVHATSSRRLRPVVAFNLCVHEREYSIETARRSTLEPRSPRSHNQPSAARDAPGTRLPLTGGPLHTRASRPTSR
jgi:hypothetical protein